MQDADFEQLMVAATGIQLQIEEYFVPDFGLPANYPGPHLIATVYAGRLATLGVDGRLVCEIAPATATALLQAANAAREEKIREGIDTAVGRPLTILKLRVDHARGPSDSFSCAAAINHYAPHALPSQWSAVLRLLRDAAGLLDAVVAEAWDRALVWASPVELGPVFQAGGVVRLPHIVTTIAHDGPLYLRTGQPPQPSSLYHLADGKLTCLDNGREIDCVDQHFTLPCGGGSLTFYREWQESLRVVIRVDDRRGIYVQRG